MSKRTSADSLGENMELSKSPMGTLRRPLRGRSDENSLLEDSESTESLSLEKEEKIDQARTLDFAHRRRWNAIVCGLMIAVTLPLFAFGGFALHLHHREVGSDHTRWLRFQSLSQKVNWMRSARELRGGLHTVANFK